MHYPSDAFYSLDAAVDKIAVFRAVLHFVVQKNP